MPQVRLHAVAALERLADPGDDGLFSQDPITKAYTKLLEVERNKDVRKCILGVMPVVKGSTIKVRHARQLHLSNAILSINTHLRTCLLSHGFYLILSCWEIAASLSGEGLHPATISCKLLISGMFKCLLSVIAKILSF